MDDELAQVLKILAVDRVQSAVGLCAADPRLTGPLAACVGRGLVKIRRYTLRPTGYSRCTVPTDVAWLSDRGRRAAADQLGHPVPPLSLSDGIEHALGVAELRRALQVPPSAWTAAEEIHAAHFFHQMDHHGRGFPDALADINGMRLALEYDHGRYTAKQVRLKQKLFPHLADEAVWAAPTRRRAEWLFRLGCQHVLVVPIRLGAYEGPRFLAS